ncbi:MAG TPA: hypothetical protein VFJ09_17025 [Nocardioidaceae bacterium]|nr:hypothetical protein [Nocardioidaceae bacterium]
MSTDQGPVAAEHGPTLRPAGPDEARLGAAPRTDGADNEERAPAIRMAWRP